MALLITRTEPGASRLSLQLKGFGFEVVCNPVLEVIFCLRKVIDWRRFSGVAITSGHAVTALGLAENLSQISALPLFTVGDRTKALALQAGWKNVFSAGGNVSDLTQLILDYGAGVSTLLYATAPNRAGKLAADLTAAGIDVEMVTAYRTDPVDSLMSATIEAIERGRIEGIVIHSSRASSALLKMLQQHGLMEKIRDVPIFTLSDAVASPVAAAGIKSIYTATIPTEADLVALIREIIPHKL